MVPDGVNRIVRLVDNELVHVHGSLLLLDQLPTLGVVNRDEAVVISAGNDEPRTVGRKHNLLDQALELAILELVQLLASLPLEDLDPRGTPR